jgi:hypothetical protein
MPPPETDCFLSLLSSQFWTSSLKGRLLVCIPASSPELQQDGFGFTSLLLFVSVLAMDFQIAPLLNVSGFGLTPKSFCPLSDLDFASFFVPSPLRSGLLFGACPGEMKGLDPKLNGA